MVVMENSIEIKTTVKFVISFVLYKYKIIKKEPDLELTDEFTNKDLIVNLKNIVWIESHYTCAEWRNFLKNHFDHMTSSPKLYATYVTFACYLKNEEYQNGFDCFLNILTLVTGFAVYALQRGFPTFKDISIEIFRTFYEKEVSKKFYNQGDWKEFSRFMQERSSLQTLNIVNHLTNVAKTPSEVASIFYLRLSDSHMISNYVLKDISETIVETHKETLSLLEKIPDAFLEETSQWKIAGIQLQGKQRLFTKKYVELVKHLKERHGKINNDAFAEMDDDDAFPEVDQQMDREKYKSELVKCSKERVTIKKGVFIEMDAKDTYIEIVKTDIASVNFDLLVYKLMKRLKTFKEITISSETEETFQWVTTEEQLQEKLKVSKKKCVELTKHLKERQGEIENDTSTVEWDASTEENDASTVESDASMAENEENDASKEENEGSYAFTVEYNASTEIIKTDIAFLNFDQYKLIERVRTLREYRQLN